ncbi:MAG: dTDP-4-dehydrorhamnose reductase [Pseudomonadota bacterium]|jgi:dTDP-4-dehydrorhamnose reductase
MRILLVGQSGQVAHELQRSLACLGQVIPRSRSTQPPLDLLNPDTIAPAVLEAQPDVIVNAAAYTQVDRAESEPETAFTVNAHAVEALAFACRELKIPLIHYSTDYVFDGKSHAPYRETDPSGPDGVYARSKLQGEEAIRGAGIPHLILRTAWVYGLHGQNFLKTMLRLMAERESLGVVNDQFGAPTWSRMIAEATTLMIALSLKEGRMELGERSGTYHLTCGGTTTWFGFAESIRALGIRGGHLPNSAATLRAITTEEYPTPARRPSYSVLDNQRLSEAFGLRLPSWEESLALCLETKPA